jgi:hypothetical protein
MALLDGKVAIVTGGGSGIGLATWHSDLFCWRTKAKWEIQ